MLRLKDASVNVTGLSHEMYFVLGYATAAYLEVGLDCVLLSAVDGQHAEGSGHALGFAVDLMTSDLTDGMLLFLKMRLSFLEKYGFSLDYDPCLIPGHELTPHFHIEYYPAHHLGLLLRLHQRIRDDASG